MKPSPETPVVVAFNGHVFGMHPKTGERLWRFDFETLFGGGQIVRLAVAGEHVYALGVGALVCIHVPTGRVLGQVKLQASGMVSTLLASDDGVLVAQNGEVSCYSREGQLMWTDAFKGEGVSEVSLAWGNHLSQADRAT